MTFEPRGPIRAQCLADFASELQNQQEQQITWTLYVDDSSNDNSCGAGVVLENPTAIKVEQSLRFNFKASNNQVEYEAIVAGLNLAEDMGKITSMFDLLPIDGRTAKWNLLGERPITNKILPEGHHSPFSLWVCKG